MQGGRPYRVYPKGAALREEPLTSTSGRRAEERGSSTTARAARGGEGGEGRRGRRGAARGGPGGPWAWVLRAAGLGGHNKAERKRGLDESKKHVKIGVYKQPIS